MSKENLFQNYSKTQSLPDGFTKKELQWGVDYFNFHFLPHLPINKDINILEIGCGWGKFLKALEINGYKNTVGVDISKDQIDIAKKNLNIKNAFLIDSIEYIIDLKENLDIVILSDVLEHLENDYSIKLFSEIRRKLNTGGKIIVQVPNGLSLLNPIRYADITHIQAFIPKSLNQIFKLAGFNQIDCFEVPPKGKNIKTKIRFFLWSFLIRPFISGFMLIANGDKMGGIYTSNIIAVITND